MGGILEALKQDGDVEGMDKLYFLSTHVYGLILRLEVDLYGFQVNDLVRTIILLIKRV